jgi:hypothetical protein
MMAHQLEAHKAHDLLPGVHDLQAYVQEAAAQGAPAHEVEHGIWRRILALGRTALGQFFDLQGMGDLGPTLELPDDRTVPRLDAVHTRNYRSIFGDFSLRRTAYGTREGQKIEFVPLDTRLQLPESDYSYLLQEWDMTLGCESSFGRVAATLEEVLGLKQSVDSLERMSRQMAELVGPFRASRPRPAEDEEGPVVVTQADGKGVVIRRAAAEPKIQGHRRKGQKAKKKRMATVGTIYTIARAQRTAEEVIESLFRDPKAQASRPDRNAVPRPEPLHKHVWASLSYEQEGREVRGTDEVFSWLRAELALRNPDQRKETVHLMDGQESLWEAAAEYLPRANVVEELDFLHVTPRVWEAAHLFFKEGSDAATAFVRERLKRILEGEVSGVVRGLRAMGTRRHLGATKRKRLETICGYFQKNAARMRYDEYLAKGYPIASGVIEGACRHYVKDRMERAGMHWTLVGAQAMLDVRSEYLNGDWTGFHKYRIQSETERLYPHQERLDELSWPVAA